MISWLKATGAVLVGLAGTVLLVYGLTVSPMVTITVVAAFFLILVIAMIRDAFFT